MNESAGEKKLRAYLEKTTTALKQTKQRLQELEAQSNEPIAIVAMACRLPSGVDTPAQLWRILDEGRDMTSPFPTDRGWPSFEDLYDPDARRVGKTYTKAGGFIDNPAYFDANFFGISPREAAAIDPQQRVMLELAWEALERANIVPASLYESSTGVFVGFTYDDYIGVTPRAHLADDGYGTLGNLYCIGSGRIAYTLGLLGPAVTIDTACSTSLVNVHLACNSLRRGETDLAFAGGATLFSTPDPLISFSRLKTLSPDGRCKAFSDLADGAGWAEGAVMLLLERLSDARKNGHEVLALVRSTAVNQDGRSQGLTAPNGPSQRRVIQAALAAAKLNASDVDMVEAHGTGTSLGDPIEAHALMATYGQDRPADRPLWLGSVKSNIAHTQAAAGAAGVMKVVLALEQQRIPKTLFAEPPSSNIDWTAGAVKLATESIAWPRGEQPRRGAVSSFGISGTNAHVIIEEAPLAEPPAPSGEPSGPIALVVSGRNEAALRSQAERLLEHLEGNETDSLASIARTLACGRTPFEQRACVVASDRQSAKDGLAALGKGIPAPNLVSGAANVDGSLAFVFPGQGSQWLGMARSLLDSSEVFRARIEECARALQPFTDWALLPVLRGEPDAASLDRVEVVQPALWAMMVGLASVWQAHGVTPQAVIGHSQGEIAAATIAGALSLEDGAKVVALRSRVITSLAGSGAMAAISMSASELAAKIAAHELPLSVAVDNGPSSTVVSGSPAAVEQLVAILEADGVFARKVNVDYASHCAEIEQVREQLLSALAGIQPRDCSIAIFSTVSAAPISGKQLDAEYWYRNLRHTVRFAEASKALLDSGYSFFVEVSPHPVMPIALAGILQAAGSVGAVVPTLRRQEGGLDRFLLSLGELHARGYAVDWSRPWSRTPVRLCSLPTYAFQRQHLWVEPPASVDARSNAGRASLRGHGLLGGVLQRPAARAHEVWEQELSIEQLPWLTDHRVHDACLFPGTGFIEMMLEAGRALGLAGPLQLEHIELQRALVMREREVELLQTTASTKRKDSWSLAVYRAASDGWQPLASATLKARGGADGRPVLARSRPELNQRRTADELYARLAERGLNYGATFRGVETFDFSTTTRSALASVQRPDSLRGATYLAHPALLDACLHVAAGLIFELAPELDTVVPVAIERIELHDGLHTDQLWCEAFELGQHDEVPLVGLHVWNSDGELLAEITGFRCAPLERTTGKDKLARALLSVDWRELDERPSPTTAPGRWLLLGSQADRSKPLRLELERRGAQVEVVTEAAPTTFEQVQRIITRASADTPLRGIINLWALDAPRLEQLASEQLPRAGAAGWATTLYLARALVGQSFRDPPRLVVLTNRALAVQAGESVNPEQSIAWGLGGPLRSEHSELRPMRIDVDDPQSTSEAEAIADLALSDTDEDQLAVRAQRCWVPRLRRTPLPKPAQYRSELSTGRHRLEVAQPGFLDSLHLVALGDAKLADDEVEIEVAAVGLNFRDVLLASGVIPPINDDGRVALGFECVGRISRVGAGVSNLEVGQRVLALANDCLATHVTAKAQLAVPVPDTLSDDDAATIPVVHLTAYHALAHVARIRAGDRVLIHSATGGVGAAALQWAKHVGARVFLTAGTEQKRAWLREQGFEHVSDSRSTAFVDEILEWTNGEGVDVVLNALAGELMQASLELVRPGGRFVEIGLRDALEDTPIGLGTFAAGMSYSLVNLAEMTRREPAYMHELLREVLEHIQRGVLQPLPVLAYPLSRAHEAIWEMGRGRHVGKFVLRAREVEPPLVSVPATLGERLVRSDRSYLITGGLGGLGLSLAKFFASQGAGQLILVGRRATLDANQRAAIAEIEAAGSTVTIAAGDVADQGTLASLIANVPAERPLAGVVHAAGVLDDALITNLTVESFERVMRPKVAGAWNLHLLTRQLPLDFFVLYGAAATLLGSPGQGNYAAANAFLDSLAAHRRSLGLPALSLAWGPFAEVGLAAAEEHRGSRLAGRGLDLLTPADGLELFSRLVTSDRVHIAPCPFDAHKWADYYLEAASWPFLSELLAEHPDADSSDSTNFLERIRDLPSERAEPAILQHVLELLSQVIRMDPAELDADTPFAALGVDSLMGIELRNRLESTTGQKLPSTAIWTYPTPRAMTAHIAAQLLQTPMTTVTTEQTSPEDDIGHLSEADTAALLADELSELEDLLDG